MADWRFYANSGRLIPRPNVLLKGRFSVIDSSVILCHDCGDCLTILQGHALQAALADWVPTVKNWPLYYQKGNKLVIADLNCR